MQERRRFVRIPQSLPISYEVLHHARIADNFTKNISQGGIRFTVQEFIPPNTILKIELPLQRIYFNFETIARVVWAKEKIPNQEYEIGVEFINISDEAAKRLLAYIKNILGIE